MVATRIRNPNGSALGLPFPFRGVLPAGGSAVVPGRMRDVLQALGGDTYRGGLDLEELAAAPTREMPFARGAFGFETQTEWVVDPSDRGSDFGDGSVGSPLKTPERMAEILSSYRIVADTEVRFLGDVGNLSIPRLDIAAGVRLTIRGTLTEVAQGTITTVTAVQAGEYFLLTTTGVDWTATSARRLELASGAVACVTHVVDANNVRVGLFASEDQAIRDFAPTNGLAFTLHQQSRIGSIVIVGAASTDYSFLHQLFPSVRLSDFDQVLADTTNIRVLNMAGETFGCTVRPSLVQVTYFALRSSLLDMTGIPGSGLGASVFASYLVLDGCGVRGVDGSVGKTLGLYQTYLENWSSCWQGTRVALLFLCAGYTFGPMPFFDWPIGNAIDVSAQSTFWAEAIIQGLSAGANANGIAVHSTSSFAYDSGLKPTVAGNAGAKQLIVGGTVTTYAAQTNLITANGASFVQYG